MAKKVDWGLKSSGPVVNGLQAALGLGAVTAVADYAAIHPIWALGAAAVGAGGTLLVRGMQSPNRVIADLARWAGAGGWSFSLLSGLADWSVGSVATLAGGAVLASCLGPAIDRREQAAAAALASGGICGSARSGSRRWSACTGRCCVAWLWRTCASGPTGTEKTSTCCCPRTGSHQIRCAVACPGWPR